MDISLYTFRDADGNEDWYSTQDYLDARDFAMKYRFEIIENTFVWEDSEPVECYIDHGDQECPISA